MDRLPADSTSAFAAVGDIPDYVSNAAVNCPSEPIRLNVSFFGRRTHPPDPKQTSNKVGRQADSVLLAWEYATPFN